MPQIAVKLKDLHPNPFRKVESYAIDESKVERLVESIESTGWWENIVVRRRKEGGVEQAHGHHRVEALRRVFKANEEVRVIVQPFTDTEMLRSMADENAEEFGHNPWSDLEVIQTVVEAYADGRIELESPARDVARDRLRYAPNFVQGDDRRAGADRSYTATGVSDFIGWPYTKVKELLRGLELIEIGALSKSSLRTAKNWTEARAIIRATSAAYQEKLKESRAAALEAKQAADSAKTPHQRKVAMSKAKKAVKAKRDAASVARGASTSIAEDIRSGKGHADASNKARAIAGADQSPKPPPNLDDYLGETISQLVRVAAHGGSVGKRLHKVRTANEHIDPKLRGRLVKQLERAAEDFAEWADWFREEPENQRESNLPRRLRLIQGLGAGAQKGAANDPEFKRLLRDFEHTLAGVEQ